MTDPVGPSGPDRQDSAPVFLPLSSSSSIKHNIPLVSGPVTAGGGGAPYADRAAARRRSDGSIDLRHRPNRHVLGAERSGAGAVSLSTDQSRSQSL